MTLAEIEKDVNAVASVVQGIADQLHGVAYKSIAGKLPVVGAVLKQLADAVHGLVSRIVNIANSIKDQVAKQAEALIPGAIDFISHFIGTIAGDIHWLVSNIATAEQFAAGFMSEFMGKLPDMVPILLEMASGGIVNGSLRLLQALEGQHREVIDHFLTDALTNPALPPFLKTAMSGLKDRGAEWQALALPALLVGFMLSLPPAMASPAVVWARQEAYKRFPVLNPPPAELTTARLKGVIGAHGYTDTMKTHGFDDTSSQVMLDNRQERLLPEEINALRFRELMSAQVAHTEGEQRGIDKSRLDLKLEAQRPLLPPDVIRDLFLRSLIKEPVHDQLLAQHGYKPETVASMKSVYYLIPGPQDLIHMAIRNVFNPEIVNRFQLFGDFPPDFEHAAAMQGISRDWALKYWGAHWIVPSNQEGFEMFQRTTEKSEDANADTYTLSDGTRVQNVIGRSTLQLLLREKDTAPYYRAKLTEIAYRPLTRIDVRRMHKVGSLTHAGVERAYLDLGYSPTNARRLADYIEKLNAQATKDQYQPMIEALAKRIVTYYIQGKLDANDATVALDDLGLTDKEVKFYLAEADFIVEADTATAVETGVGKLYVDDLLTADAAAKRLTTAGVPAVAIRRLFIKWNLQREFRTLSAEHGKVRDLTKSEILSAVEDGLMDDATALPHIMTLGYKEDAAHTELALAHFRADRASRRTQIDSIKALYISQQYDRLTTITALDGLSVPHVQRDAFLAEWTLTREQRVEKLPIATVRDMFRAGFMNDDDAAAQLRKHRFTETDVRSLLDFWGQQPLPGGVKRVKQSGG